MLAEHRGYASDGRRTQLFRAAVEKVVRPCDIVADVGCGTGILGLLCLQAGAARVVGIDSTGIIDVAREAFARAGLVNRCLFIRGSSFQVEIPERADVLICDHVGYFGFDYGVVDLLADARRRFLKPHGAVIPSGIALQLAAVESTDARAQADGWRSAAVPPEYHWLSGLGINAKYAVELTPRHVLGPPAELGYIDLTTDTPDFLSWTANLVVERDGTLHGLAGWFRCELAAGVSMTNSPLDEGKIDRPQAFLPIGEAVPVASGDQVVATVMMRPSESLIAWSVGLPKYGKRFRHSTWDGLMLGTDDLVRADPDRIPRLSRNGRAREIVLGYCDGHRTSREIEELVLKLHPGLLPSRREISRFVTAVLARDTE